MNKWIGKVGECNICQGSISDWFVDGKTNITGQWALMCPSCFEKYGVGLGTGRGQKYDYETREKVEG